MDHVRAAIAVCVGALLAGSLGCYAVLYERQDKANIRRQFHLPRDATFVAFDSNPKSAGFMGREGLSISAAVEMSEPTFEAWVGAMNDPEVWTGVPFISYSPDRAETYSDASLRWTDVAEPDLGDGWTRHWDLLDVASDVKRGRYYCSTIVMRRGEPLAPGSPAYQWHNLGRACSELGPNDSAVVRVLGVLDLDARRLYALIQFSG